MKSSAASGISVSLRNQTANTFRFPSRW